MTCFATRQPGAVRRKTRQGAFRQVLAVAVLGFAVALPPGTAYAETLWQALRNTHVNNSKLNSERARSMAEGEKVNAARSGYFPQISANADAGYARNGIDKYTNTMPRGFGVSATQAIFNPRLGPENEKARAEADAAMAVLISAEQQTLLDATQAFLSVIREQRVISLRQSALGTMRQMQAQAVGRQQAGDLTRTSVDQTRARVAEAEADMAQAHADRADAEALYKMVVGLAPQRPSEPSLAGVQLPRSLNEAIAIAESENPKIAAALQNARAAESGVGVARAGYLPTLGAEGSFRRGFEDDNLIGQAGQNATVRLRLSVPIFNGGLTAAQVRQAENLRDQRNFEAEDMRKNVRRAVESAFMQHNGAVLRRAASQKRVEASAAALKGLDIEFQAGNMPLYTVLDGRRELVNAQVALARANYDVTMTAFILLAGMGRFDLERILSHNGNNASVILGRRVVKHMRSPDFADTTGALPRTGRKIAAPPREVAAPAGLPATEAVIDTRPPQSKTGQKPQTGTTAAAVDAMDRPGTSLVETAMPQAAPPPRRAAPRGLLPLLMQHARDKAVDPANTALQTEGR